jgi:3-methylcrotonyl-CoA carboxylase alpha subunit
MSNALGEYQIVGPPNNVTFLQRAVNHPVFQKGVLDTGFIKANLPSLLERGQTISKQHAQGLALVHLLLSEHKQTQASHRTPDYVSPWEQATSWRPNMPAQRNVTLIPHGSEKGEKVEMTSHGESSQGMYDFGLTFSGGVHVPAKVSLTSGVNVTKLSPSTTASQFNALIGEQKYHATVVENGRELHVMVGGEHHLFLLPLVRFGGQHENVDAAVQAPMAGKVVKVLVQGKQKVAKGTSLVIMEAMKMEHVIKAPKDGVVEKILYSTGDFVEGGKSLVTFVQASK